MLQIVAITVRSRNLNRKKTFENGYYNIWNRIIPQTVIFQ